MHEIENYTSARKRNKAYCRKQVKYYECLCRLAQFSGQGGSPQQYAKQSDWWKRQAKSLVPLHPTEDEEDIEAEEPLDACIRDAEDRLNDFMDKKSAE